MRQIGPENKRQVANNENSENDDGVWIFGYGSLIWRPDFDFVERRFGSVAGWTRRFWQGSTDHRGVPDAPGRVVTLEPATHGTVWGVAYRVAAAVCEPVLQALDHREQGGYRREFVQLAERCGRQTEVLVYLATNSNPNYLGPASTAEIASQIAAAVGPSGRNDDYLFRLAESLRHMRVEDEHVFELEAAVRVLISNQTSRGSALDEDFVK